MGWVVRAGSFSPRRLPGKMFSLTAREQTLLVVVMTATLLGAAAKHWRDVRREQRAAVSAPAVPGRAVGARGKAAAPRPQPAPAVTQVALAEEALNR